MKFTIGTSSAVRLATTTLAGSGPEGSENRKLVLTNANPEPVTAEIDLAEIAEADLRKASAKVVRKDGKHVWQVTVPANDSATISYQLRFIDG